MKTQKIVLVFALASTITSFASATNYVIDTGLANTLQILSYKTDGDALNLAVNTANVDASVNTIAGLNWIAGAIETSAIGAVNTGSINLQLGEKTTHGLSGVDYDIDDKLHHKPGHGALDPDYSVKLEASVDGVASNYAAANVAYNSGNIDASVNTIALGNRVDSITTSAIGAAQTGNITVTVK